MSRPVVLLTLAVALALGGCGRKPSEEECARSFEHLLGLMKKDERYAAQAGMIEGQRGRILEQCRQGSKKELACIQKAADIDAAWACGGRAPPKADASQAEAAAGAGAAAGTEPAPDPAAKPDAEMEFEPEQPE